MTEAADMTKCPVCRAAFRAVSPCTRCGADLGPVMQRIALAWSLRRRARARIRAGQYGEAEQLARAALETHATASAWDLVLLTAMLHRRALCIPKTHPRP